MSRPQRKPIPSVLPPSAVRKTITASLAGQPKRWTFSLRYWRQIEFFAVGGDISKAWFVSLLERLQELSSELVDDLQIDFAKMDALRIHDIDWNATNIPIRRTDLNWLPNYYVDDPENYPLLQIHISKALGRLVGFRDESSVFQIVLLDPLHNIQPSGTFSYRIRNTTVQRCLYSNLLNELERVKKKNCNSEFCAVTEALAGIPSSKHDERIAVILFTEKHFRDAVAALELAGESRLDKLIEAGLEALTQSNEANG